MDKTKLEIVMEIFEEALQKAKEEVQKAQIELEKLSKENQMKKLIVLVLFFATPLFAAGKKDAYLQDEIVSPVGRYQLANVHQEFVYLKDGKETPGEDQTVAKIDTMTGRVYLLRYIGDEFVWMETRRDPLPEDIFSEIPLSKVKATEAKISK